jgi:hypothetical protein
MKQIFLFILYLSGIFLLYPIIQYYFVVARSPHAVDYLVFVRVYFCAPLLIIIGTCLFFLYKKVNKISGLIFFAAGVYWLIILLKEIMIES